MNRKKTFDSILKLISIESIEQDKYGVPIVEETSHEVYCKELSISQSADFQARQLGIKWDKKFAIHSFEYNGEQILEHNGIRYVVDRVYGLDLNETELTCILQKETIENE